jgi:hypothetical protein
VQLHAELHTNWSETVELQYKNYKYVTTMHSQYKNIKNTVTKKGTDTIYKETKDIKLNVMFNNATQPNFFFNLGS